MLWGMPLAVLLLGPIAWVDKADAASGVDTVTPCTTVRPISTASRGMAFSYGFSAIAVTISPGWGGGADSSGTSAGVVYCLMNCCAESR